MGKLNIQIGSSYWNDKTNHNTQSACVFIQSSRDSKTASGHSAMQHEIEINRHKGSKQDKQTVSFSG